ncbi:hypothetical protein [Streptomyces sp. NPDC058653]|uniref:hypothetical protein n=1 Tax=Streptomyces sp. NPDC058653 TaxID=3346576 RepID=UPI003656B342
MSTSSHPDSFVLLIGEFALAVASSPKVLQVEAITRASQYGSPAEYRWDEHHNGLRLMSRRGGRGRFSWTQYWVATVPTLTEGGAS